MASVEAALNVSMMGSNVLDGAFRAGAIARGMAGLTMGFALVLIYRISWRCDGVILTYQMGQKEIKYATLGVFTKGWNAMTNKA